MNRKKKPPAGEGERLRGLKGLLNSNFDEKDLTVSIHYAPDRTETQSRKQEE